MFPVKEFENRFRAILNALDDFEALSARYRPSECAHAEADSIDRLVALARLNLPKGVIGLS